MKQAIIKKQKKNYNTTNLNNLVFENELMTLTNDIEKMDMLTNVDYTRQLMSDTVIVEVKISNYKQLLKEQTVKINTFLKQKYLLNTNYFANNLILENKISKQNQILENSLKRDKAYNIDIINKVLTDIDCNYNDNTILQYLGNDKPIPRYNYGIYYLNYGKNSEVYVFGGCLKNQNTGEMELFNDLWKFKNNNWTCLHGFIKNIEPRYNCGLVVIQVPDQYDNLIVYNVPIIIGGIGVQNKQLKEAYYVYPMDYRNLEQNLFGYKQFVYPGENINSNLCNSVIYNYEKNSILLFQSDCLYEYNFSTDKQWNLINSNFFANNNIYFDNYYLVYYNQTAMLITLCNNIQNYWYFNNYEWKLLEFKSSSDYKYLDESYVFYIYINFYDESNNKLYLVINEICKLHDNVLYLAELEIVPKSSKRKTSYIEQELILPYKNKNLFLEQEPYSTNKLNEEEEKYVNGPSSGYISNYRFNLPEYVNEEEVD